MLEGYPMFAIGLLGYQVLECISDTNENQRKLHLLLLY